MKNALYLPLFILCSFLTLSFRAEAAQKGNIYVLKSSGICDGCSEAVSKMLFTAGIHSQILGPSELKKNVTTDDLLIIGGGIPGGEGEWTIKQDLTQVGAFDWVKKHIANGGRYLGICAGAYLTERWIDKEAREYGLNIFPGEIDNYSKVDKNAKVLQLNWLNPQQNRFVYFQDGPAFYPKKDADIQILARFAKDQTPAAVIFPWGKGKVGLISPHLEADYDWTRDEHLKDKDGLDYDLGIQVVRQVLE